MITIYKYTLRQWSEQVVAMPAGAELLAVQVQHDQICLWARVDDAASPVRRSFQVCGTGHVAPSQGSHSVRRTFGTYVGTVQLQAGALVLHVFDMGEAP